MRKIMLVAVALMVCVVATAQRVAIFEDLDNRSDVYYDKLTGEPYTGIVEDMSSNSNDYMRLFFEKGVAVGVFEGFYDAGRTVKKWTVPIKNGRQHGEYLCFYEDGSIQFKARKRKGNLSGERNCYHESGALWHVHHYRKEKEVGQRWEYYDLSEGLYNTSKYRDGQQNGKWRAYHKNGKIYQKGRYKNGSQTGKWREYSEDGDLMAVTIYKRGAAIKTPVNNY